MFDINGKLLINAKIKSFLVFTHVIPKNDLIKKRKKKFYCLKYQATNREPGFWDSKNKSTQIIRSLKYILMIMYSSRVVNASEL